MDTRTFVKSTRIHTYPGLIIGVCVGHGNPTRRLMTHRGHIDTDGLDPERTTFLRVNLEIDLGLALLVDLESESLCLDLVVVELVGLGEELLRRLRVVGVHFPTCGSTRLRSEEH